MNEPRVLVVNAGSSSVKLRLVDGDDRLDGSADLDEPAGPPEDGAVDDAVEQALVGFGPADVVGHRVVHGGRTFAEPVVVDDDVLDALEGLTDLAPLHQPPAIRLIRTIRRLRPDLTAVACFDTAFHATLPAAAATYPVPADWRDRLGVRRYGFHGLSHAWASRRAAEMVGRDLADLAVVTCHLGAGASLAAVAGGLSVDTTMGFTPIDGLVMATRCGALDPGLVVWLARHAGIPAARIDEQLSHESGLLALAGTADMKEVDRRAAAGDADAVLALAVYLHRLRSGIASMVAALGRLDVLAFTGGVGEHSASVRAKTVSGLGFLGLAVDAVVNEAATGDTDISSPDSPVRTLVVEAREDLEIARLTRATVSP